MKRVICLPYTINQNEPSVPVKEIVELPDGPSARIKTVKQLFIKHVCNDADESDIEVALRRSADDYGDIVVSFEGDMFLFITFID